MNLWKYFPSIAAYSVYLCVYVQKVGDEMSGAGMEGVLVFFSFCALSGWI